MRRRIVKNESGIALPVAIMIVVLIGVMGAGLLTFTMTGLKSVAEVNRGQKAFDMADAGVQTAKRQLIANAAPTHYDGIEDSTIPLNPESPWSYYVPPSGGPSGKALSLDGCTDCINVKIRYLRPATTQAQQENQNNPGCQVPSLPCFAPMLLPSGEINYPAGEDYFLVVSEGNLPSGANADGARRRVEAIYATQNSGVPQGYFTQGNIDLGGNLTIEGLSMFAIGSISYNGNPTMVGTDLAYGSWDRPPWNTKARSTNVPGFGAVGQVLGTGALNTRDFGSNSSPTKFVLENPSSNQMTFPFDYRQQPNLEDQRSAALLQDTANRTQGNYYELPCATGQSLKEDTAAGTGPKWPANSTPETVVYVKFTCASFSSSSVLNWDVSASVGDRKGTLVVENGKLEMSQQTACLNGIATIRGVPTGELAYNAGGANSCLKGYVNASGVIRIRGSIKPFAQDRGNRPGFFKLQLWSWREMYK